MMYKALDSQVYFATLYVPERYSDSLSLFPSFIKQTNEFEIALLDSVMLHHVHDPRWSAEPTKLVDILVL